MCGVLLCGLGTQAASTTSVSGTWNPSAPAQPPPQLVRAGRFLLSGGKLTEPLQGRYEWLALHPGHRIWLSSPLGDPIGSFRCSVCQGGDSDWVMSDAGGEAVAEGDARRWASRLLDESAGALDVLTRLLQDLISQAQRTPGPLSLQASGLTLRLLPDSDSP
ncbi:MAG: hypothetical protein EBQ76_00935 [Betaproteobacteria bacterium]|nr:hypothetical protein [Betaproteobacteria bacterium]